MHQLVPQFILENYSAGNFNGSFPAAGLFVDTSGFSAMTDTLMSHGQHGAEVLAGVMSAIFEPLIRSVFEQGGFVTSQEGDAFTALFPVDNDPVESAQRAISAAWNIQQAVSRQAPHHTPYGDFTIIVKVGMELGQAEWGIITSARQERAAYYFRGSAIDGAAQAEHLAHAGDILMGANIFAQVRDCVDAEPNGEVYRLLAASYPFPAPLPVTQPASNLEAASHFFPRRILQQSREIRGEFRQVVYLFISLPTIRNLEQLRIFMQTVFELQDQYGGLFELFFGDKGAYLLLFWGAPISHENDVERSLNFILDLQSRTAIPINGGITFRIAHAGYIGGSLAEDYSAFGRGANLAARFMTAAPRGEIWVDENIFRKAARLYNLEYAGEQVFKGFSLPQKVYILVDRKDEDEIIFDGTLCGREQEIRTVTGFMQPIFQGAYAGVLLVRGEAGIGKSRLVHESLHRLELDTSPGPQVFLCQTDEILRQSLNPFRYWLHRYFQVFDTQGDGRNKRNFNRKLDEIISQTGYKLLADEIDRARSFLGALVNLYWPDSLYEQVDARMRYENAFTALASLIKAESLRKPVVLFLEDAHWFDDDTRAFLSRLLHNLESKSEPGFPIAVIITARSEENNTILEDIACLELQLKSIDHQALAALANSLLDTKSSNEKQAISEHLLALLEERAEGNPFFAGQILLYLKDQGLVSLRQGAWDILPGQSLTLPADVGVLLVARLDRLMQEVKNVVQTAAILGREFEVNLLACMLDEKNPAKVPPEIAAAEREAIWSAVSEMRYIFKHTLMREAAYQMQLHNRRQELHAQAFMAYERLYRDSLPNHYGELAYHADQAGLADKAVHYLDLAGQAARNAFQNSLAASYFTRALDLVPGENLQKQSELLLQREAIYTLQGKIDDRHQDLILLENIARHSGDPDLQLQVLLARTSFALDTGAYPEAYLLAEQYVQAAGPDGKSHGTAMAYNYLALASLRLSKLSQAENEAKNGLLAAKEAHDQEMQSTLLNTLGMIMVGQEKLEIASQYFQEGLARARDTGNLRDQALPLNNLGMIATMQGNFSAAEHYYEQALVLARKIGDRAGESLVLGNLGFIAGSLGDFLKARQFAERTLQISREVGDPMNETYALINLSAFAGSIGDFETGVHSALESQVLARKTGDRSAEAWSYTYLGHNMLAKGYLPGASTAYQAALDIRTELSQSVLATEPSAGLAQVALRLGQVDEAWERIAPILHHLEDDGTLAGTDEPLRIYLTCFLVLQQVGDDRAQGMLKTAHETLQARAGLITDEITRQRFLEEIPHHREIITAWQQNQVI
jgi:predicted ATPase/class 3 adenylate cyclase